MITFDKIGFEIKYTTDSMRESKAVETSLSYFNPNSSFSRSQYWDGFVRYYNKRHKTFNFGHLSTVINFLIKKDFDFQINGVDVDIFKPTVPYTKGLHIHQLAALHAFFQTKHGIIKVPTRGGKTFIASEAIRLITIARKEYPVLFVVDSELLFNQAINDISGFLKINPESIGQIKEDTFDIKQITVAMIQTLTSITNGIKRLKASTKVKEPKPDAKRTKKILTVDEIKAKRKEKRGKINDLNDYLKSVKFLIVDECHEYSSPDRIELVKKVDEAEFYMFLSASPFKSENMFANLSNKGICGDILYEIPEQLLKERGILAKDKILLIEINHNDNPNINFNQLQGYRDFLDKVIVSNQQRNQIVINVCETCRKLELKTLGLFMFKKHGYNISKITGDPFITGVNDLDEREFVKKQFLDNKGGVLLASDIFKKGITLPDVEVMVNIGGGKEQSGITQKKGRVLGTTDIKKKALIVDFIDDCEYFGEHSLKRIEVYEESVGIDNIVILNSDDEDFYPQMREFIKQWFQSE